MLEVIGLSDVDADQGHELQLGQPLPRGRRKRKEIPQVGNFGVDEISPEFAGPFRRFRRVEPGKEEKRNRNSRIGSGVVFRADPDRTGVSPAICRSETMTTRWEEAILTSRSRPREKLRLSFPRYKSSVSHEADLFWIRVSSFSESIKNYFLYV